MKRKIQTLILVAFLLGLSNCKKEASDVIYKKSYIEEIKAARKAVSVFVASNFIPGASVTVIKDNEIIYSDAFGYASKDLMVPAKRATKFRIGSLSQLFTNVLYHKLVEEGTLHPDSSIQHYYPDFPEKEHPLTLKHLVQHTSGIRLLSPQEETGLYLNHSLEKGLELFKHEDLAATPGLYQYESQFNYNLLGVVMEKASKKSFRHLLKEMVTDTLHLDNTVLDNPLQIIENRSNFFDHNYLAQIINSTTIDLRYRAPADGMLSTAEDLAKLGLTIMDSDFLSVETQNTLFEPELLFNNIPSQMSNGWMLLTDRDGRTVYGKSGSVQGGGGALILYPSENLVISYVCNLTTPMDNTPIFKIAEHFLPLKEKKSEEQ